MKENKTKINKNELCSKEQINTIIKEYTTKFFSENMGKKFDYSMEIEFSGTVLEEYREGFSNYLNHILSINNIVPTKYLIQQYNEALEEKILELSNVDEYIDNKNRNDENVWTDDKIKELENELGYTFRNKKLLKLAFRRKSYAVEHGSDISNEYLEYIGDSVIDLCVNKRNSLIIYPNKDESVWHINLPILVRNENVESALTIMKQNMVNTDNLSDSLDDLTLNLDFDLFELLLTGNADKNIIIKENKNIKADLFEAIIGAITIDSDWDINKIETILLGEYDIFDHLNTSTGILYDPFNLIAESTIDYYNVYQWYNHTFNKNLELKFIKENNEYLCYIEFDLNNVTYNFNASASSKKIAKTKCLEKLDKFVNQVIQENNEKILDNFINKTTLDSAVNVLQEMYQAKIITEPIYNFYTSYDQNGSPIWDVILSFTYDGNRDLCIDYSTKSSSKKLAKKISALATLKNLKEILSFRPNIIHLDGITYKEDNNIDIHGYFYYNQLKNNYYIANNLVSLVFSMDGLKTKYNLIKKGEDNVGKLFLINNGDNIYDIIKNNLKKVLPEFDMNKCHFLEMEYNTSENSNPERVFKYKVLLNESDIKVLEDNGYTIVTERI